MNINHTSTDKAKKLDRKWRNAKFLQRNTWINTQNGHNFFNPRFKALQENCLRPWNQWSSLINNAEFWKQMIVISSIS